MCMNISRTNLKVAGIFSVVILILAALPAEAQQSGNRSFTLAGRQWLLIERMTNSALLAALEIEASPSLGSIHWSRDRFDRTQTELRDGDAYLGVSPTTRPEILETLDNVDSRWRRYDVVFQEILTSASVSEAQIRVLAASHAETMEALGQMVDSYEYFVYGGSTHSMLSSAIEGTGDLRASTQLVLRGLLMAAYSGYEMQERQLLIQMMGDFDRTINGLIYGNSELRLLPAPNDEIRDELMKVELMWQEIRPILDSATVGDAATKDEIATVAQRANDMAVPLTKALIMYLII